MFPPYPAPSPAPILEPLEPTLLRSSLLPLPIPSTPLLYRGEGGSSLLMYPEVLSTIRVVGEGKGTPLDPLLLAIIPTRSPESPASCSNMAHFSRPSIQTTSKVPSPAQASFGGSVQAVEVSVLGILFPSLSVCSSLDVSPWFCTLYSSCRNCSCCHCSCCSFSRCSHCCCRSCYLSVRPVTRDPTAELC